ncbi:endonuclease/exonuclease/phosphatase family protein [Aerococcus viridans]
MKLLTLNTHSYGEDDQDQKLAFIAQSIAEWDIDVVCLQEVNQKIFGHRVDVNNIVNFVPMDGQVNVKEDNFAMRLVALLAELGKTYYWAWAMTHIAHDTMQEGVAILSKYPIDSVTSYNVSKSHDWYDYKTRRILTAKITKPNGESFMAVSGHFSWWHGKNNEEFHYEWQETEKYLARTKLPIYFMGDFNNPANTEGYDYMVGTDLPIQDAYPIAEEQIGESTVLKEIAGWTGLKEQIRIDYIFVPKDVKVKTSEVVFDGERQQAVSDHSGVLVETID